jgi:cyclophilin family peptidyl-prolyl cis-trans isomerase
VSQAKEARAFTRKEIASTTRMALEGKKNQNGSQFCISLREDNQYFEEKNTVIGRVIKGLDFILSLQDNCEIHEEKPVRPLMITSCGELTFGDKLAKE